jgi:magnesium-transporting ATPase (P-type)
MSTLVTGYKNEKDLLLKGAPDRIIKKCTHYMGLEGVREMTSTDRELLMKNIA